MGQSRKLSQKYNELIEAISAYDSAIVAFSGGVDSTLVLKASIDVLKDRVMAVSAISMTYTQDELSAARAIAAELKVDLKIIMTDELEDEKFIKNDADRCFYCKSSLFSKLKEIATKLGYDVVFDGSNLDDLYDYRPGRKAAEKFNIISPLLLAGFTKDDVRHVSRYLGLSTWSKPALACLASRFPYGTRIEEPALKKVAKAESFLRSIGLKEVRVRFYDNLARIEVSVFDLPRFSDNDFRRKILSKVKNFGFEQICLDLEGYRTGSMNEILDDRDFAGERIIL